MSQISAAELDPPIGHAADQDLLSRLAEVRLRATAARDAGRLEEALAEFDAARALAAELGDARLVDRFLCSRVAVALELGGGREEMAQLREILLRNVDDENCFLAAYTIARGHELARDAKKGLFYARLARDRAAALGRDEWLASSHNLIGNLLAADSHFEAALAQYRVALEDLGQYAGLRRDAILHNLGYCLVVTGARETGMRCLYSAVRGLRRSGALATEARARLDLCFAHLGGQRADLAERHGQRALAIATELELQDERKNALFLLGQAARQSGRELLARQRFGQLRDSFYPDADYLVELLLTVDVRPLLNLRA